MMGMNKQTGHMYPFVTHTWNPIRGICPHKCSYCYMKGFVKGEPRFIEKEMDTDLGAGNFIFVGSSIDMFTNEILFRWIEQTIDHCDRFLNTYLFQSKNPANMLDWDYPIKTILGTTLETNRETPSIAPLTIERYEAMAAYDGRKMVSIEPIMDFDDEFIDWIRAIKPEFVSIGADSKGHHLPEPSPDKLKALINELKGFTEVRLKSNLRRLTEGQS